MSPHLLAQGYAVASNSLNAQEQNCNDVVAAEAFAMTREHFIETHGLPAFTMGIGCSGGAAQAYQTADNYPGLLDGIVVGCSLADIGSDIAQLAFDARLLEQFARAHPGRLTEQQLVAVSGLSSAQALAAMSDHARILDPVAGFLGSAVPPPQRYGASNPRGARGTVWDQTVNVYGVADQAGHARRPLGNVGVQYGLTALQRGRISLEAFIELNADIGGLDDDLRWTKGRTLADAQATRAAYASGRVLNGGGGLSDIPIIDYRRLRVRAEDSAAGPGAPHLCGAGPFAGSERRRGQHGHPQRLRSRPVHAGTGGGRWSHRADGSLDHRAACAALPRPSRRGDQQARRCGRRLLDPRRTQDRRAADLSGAR